MLGRLLALFAIVALVLLPGLHAHGAADGACVACVHQAGAAALLEAPPTEPVVPAPATWQAAPETAARFLPHVSIFRPLALSPPDRAV